MPSSRATGIANLSIGCHTHLWAQHERESRTIDLSGLLKEFLEAANDQELKRREAASKSLDQYQLVDWFGLKG
jgi:hypothetical protein